MTRDEVVKVLAILKVSYPNFYQHIDKTTAQQTVALWESVFAHDNPKLVYSAVMELINNFKYPPTIADIRETMDRLQNPYEETATELWEKLLKAIGNGSYGYMKEFEKLPLDVQTFLGSPTQLQELARVDSKEINTVVKGQFLKQIEVIKKRNKDQRKMSSQAKEFLNGNVVKQIE